MIAKTEIFPTPIYSGSIENFEAVNKVIIEILYKLKGSDKRINKAKGLLWQSSYGLHLDHGLHAIPEFYFLKNFIFQAANSIIRSMGYNITLNYYSLSGNIVSKYANIQTHDHSPAMLSGIYYLKVPQPTVNLILHDPRLVKAFVSKGIAKQKTIINEYTKSTIEINPVEGNYLFFPSWLKHGTLANSSEEDRISLNFNFIMDPASK